MGKNQHVAPRGSAWGVIGAGNERATVIVPTQQEAIDRAREIADNQGSELFVHNRRGQIRERDSHGRDSHRRRG